MSADCFNHWHIAKSVFCGARLKTSQLLKIRQNLLQIILCGPALQLHSTDYTYDIRWQSTSRRFLKVENFAFGRKGMDHPLCRLFGDRITTVLYIYISEGFLPKSRRQFRPPTYTILPFLLATFQSVAGCPCGITVASMVGNPVVGYGLIAIIFRHLQNGRDGLYMKTSLLVSFHASFLMNSPTYASMASIHLSVSICH